MAYDPDLGYVVAYDEEFRNTTGSTSYSWASAPLTWKFANDSWSLLNVSASPPPFEYPMMSYDAADHSLVLFGDVIMTHTEAFTMALTWTFANGSWSNQTNLSQPYPPVANDPGIWQMTYDASDRYVLLYGGATWSAYGDQGETWTYRAGVWTNRTGPLTDAPPAAGMLGYDSALGAVVRVGGLRWNWSVVNWSVVNWSTPSNVTWTFHAGVWTNATADFTGTPPSVILGAIVDDPADGGLLLFGGEPVGPTSPNWSAQPDTNETWLLHNSTWTRLNLTSSPSPRDLSLATYDSGRKEVVLFSGFGSVPGPVLNGTPTSMVSPLFDTWTFTNGSWLLRAPVLSLSASVMDTGGLLTITVPGGAGLAETDFFYSGLPPGCAGQNAATFTCRPTGAGNFTLVVEVAAGGLGFARSRLVVNSPPRITSFGSNRSATDVGLGFTLSTVATGGTGGLAYAYAGLPTGCPAGNGPTVDCTPATAGSARIRVDVTDTLGVQVSANVSVQVNPRPLINDLHTIPTNLTVGQPFVVEFAVSGGTGGYTTALSGLPHRCTAMNLSSFECPALSPGTYALNVTATDLIGVSSYAISTLDVPAPVSPIGGSHTGSSEGGAWLGPLAVGSAVGLVGIAAVATWVVGTRRRRRDGERLVQQLEEAEMAEP